MFKVRKLEKGMMTVEASLLLSVVFFVLVLILYFFFYCYESGTAEGILRQEMTNLSDTVKTSANIKTGEYDLDILNQRKLTYLLNPSIKKLESQCASNIKMQLSKKSLFGRDAKVSIKTKNGAIQGSISSKVSIPILGSIEIGGFSFFSVHQEVTTQIRMPAEQIRRWQQIE